MELKDRRDLWLYAQRVLAEYGLPVITTKDMQGATFQGLSTHDSLIVTIVMNDKGKLYGICHTAYQVHYGNEPSFEQRPRDLHYDPEEIIRYFRALEYSELFDKDIVSDAEDSFYEYWNLIKDNQFRARELAEYKRLHRKYGEGAGKHE